MIIISQVGIDSCLQWIPLPYGEDFVPKPKFDDHQFRLEAQNASNKLERLANTLARESRQPSLVNDTEEEEQQLALPKELRYRGVCLPPVNDHHHPLVTQVVNSINQFADTVTSSQRNLEKT